VQDLTQISAFISATTKARLERYTEGHGLKKGAFIEAALLHHLQALEELPLNVVIPPRVVISAASYDLITSMIDHPPEPTAALSALMRGEPVEGLDD
jgi:hypothetical protein